MQPLLAEEPLSLVEGVRIERLLSEPDLVTPVGCSVAPSGEIFVVESHTHFPPENYDGPKNDRIWRFADRDGDGTLETRQVVVDDTRFTMQVLADAGDGWLYFSTRNAVFRQPLNSRGSNQRQTLLQLKTEADYPHNGLSGLAYDPRGLLYVGIGENFGATHQLTGSDGMVIGGSGEGGSVYRMRSDGSGLERIGTGFWNPFGMCFDLAGRLWVVGNDPDASPPCRLLHLVPGGDYGFQFRFGRAGTNPLQAWNGQLPGTLGFAAGTGEAPCAVVAHRGWLWVTSWGDNRIERYRLQADGAQLTGLPEVVIQGGPLFRPTGMGLGPDGALYVCDWVDRSYTLHKLGRLWRITCDARVGEVALPMRSAIEQQAARLAADDTLWLTPDRDGTEAAAKTERPAADADFQARLAGLGDQDPFVRAAASWGLIRTGQWRDLAWQSLPTGRARAHALLTLRWLDLEGVIPIETEQRIAAARAALADQDPEVQLAGLRWIAERTEKSLTEDVARLLDRADLTPQVVRVALATKEWLDTGTVERQITGGQKAAVDLALNEQRSDAVRAQALAMLDPRHEALSTPALAKMAAKNGALGREAVRSLALRMGDESRFAALAQLADDPTLTESIRADAVMGLAEAAEDYRDLLERLAKQSRVQGLRREAQRILGRIGPGAASVAAANADRPAPNDLDGWLVRVGEGGDRDAGWRVFFRTGTGQCSACHAYGGRGARAGPDLSTLAGQQPRSRILESILDPHREIGPLYTPWQIETVDGRVLTGLKLHEPGIGEQLRFLASDGTTFDIELEEIEQQRMISRSIMPEGLWQSLSDEELRDLLALLSNT